jgi:hypothetical protein
MSFPPVLLAHLSLTLSSEILGDIRDAGQPAINLPTVEDARYNSADVQDNPKCLEGTRVGIRGEITAWADGMTSEPIFWLFGPAGTGKSTIARTLADSFKERGQLAAGYFFKRGHKAQNGTARFFPTIAAQLIGTIPPFAAFLRTSLKTLTNAHTDIENMVLEEQFTMLIRTPLSEMPTDHSGKSRVIIIDALDECERPDHIDRILIQLSELQKLDTLRLRVLLTSRSAGPIVDVFEDLEKKRIARSLSLLDFAGETKEDIKKFLQETFAGIKKRRKISKAHWPEPEDLDRLVTLATNPSPLFIYAATLCRSVDNRMGGANPVRRLKRWLEKSDSNASELDQKLNQMYEAILNEVWFETGLDNDEQRLLREVLRSIVLLATPLPSGCLAGLLAIEDYDVNSLLPNLHAVLDLPSKPDGPVEILHKSFSDFLLGQEVTGTADFRVDAEETHAMLASKCIQRMENGLSKDICSVRDPGKSRGEIDKAIIVRHIPPDLEYACLYWVYHLQHSGRRITDRDEVCTFLYTHFLHWLESLSWIRKISEGILTIASLETITLVSLPAVYRKLLN